MSTFGSTGTIVGTYVSVLLLLIVLANVGSIVTYIIIVVANRAEPDPTGKRTSAVHHVGTTFPAQWLEIAGDITIFATLFALIGDGKNTYFGPVVQPLSDATVGGITMGLLLTLVSGLLTLTHRRKAVELSLSHANKASPSKRVVRSYAAVESFISVIVMVIAVLVAVWAVLGLVAPSVYQTGSRTSDVRALLDEATVLAVFARVFSTHWRLASVQRSLELP